MKTSVKYFGLAVVP